MNLTHWLRELLRPPEPEPELLDAQVAALAAAWRVDPPIVWHFVRLYALEHRVSLLAAAEALHGLDLDEAKRQVGEG